MKARHLLLAAALFPVPLMAAPPTSFDTYVKAAGKLGFEGAEPWQITGLRGWKGREPKTGTELYVEMKPVDALAILHVTSFDLAGWQVTLDLVKALDPEASLLMPALRPDVGRWIGGSEYMLHLVDNRIGKAFRRLEIVHLGSQDQHARLAAAHHAAAAVLLNWARSIHAEERRLIEKHGDAIDDVPRNEVAESMQRARQIFRPAALYDDDMEPPASIDHPALQHLVCETAAVCSYICDRTERDQLFGPTQVSPFDEILLVIHQAMERHYYGPFAQLREHASVSKLPPQLEEYSQALDQELIERLPAMRDRAAHQERDRVRQADTAARLQTSSSSTPRPTTPTPSASGSSGRTVHVKGYYRKDGTYVQPHTRRPPSR